MRGIVAGAISGAAGTVALNASTYIDMAVRARPASSMPEEAVQRLADAVTTFLHLPGLSTYKCGNVVARTEVRSARS